MSRWGKNIVVPLDSLCKEKENTNRPTVARSVGTVGKWGKMGFTSTRTYSLTALPASMAAAAAAAAASPVESPASLLDDDMSPSVPEPPKPKKFFKSRNTAPPEVIAQMIQQLPRLSTSPIRDSTSSSAMAAPSLLSTPVHGRESIKLKIPKSNSAERKKKSPKKSSTVKPVNPESSPAVDMYVDEGAEAVSPAKPISEAKTKKKKEEKKLKPEAPPSRIIPRARKAVNYCEVDEEERTPTPVKDLLIPKHKTERQDELGTNSLSSPCLPPPLTAAADNSASKTPEHPPIVLRISKGTSRLVSTDSDEQSPNVPIATEFSPHHNDTEPLNPQSSTPASGVDTTDQPYTNACLLSNTPKIIVKPPRPPSPEQIPETPSQPTSDLLLSATTNFGTSEINYSTVKISPDKPPKERLKLIIKGDVIRNAIAAAAAAAAAKSARTPESSNSGTVAASTSERPEKEKKPKSKKHKHTKHDTPIIGHKLGPSVAVAPSDEFKTPSPHLALGNIGGNESQQHLNNRTIISPPALSERDFDSQSSVLGSISSKGNSTPHLAPTVNEESCVVHSRGSSVITSDLETSQHSSLVAPPSDIESRLESMMMDDETTQKPLSLPTEEPLQEDILAVLQGDESQAETLSKVNGVGEQMDAHEPENTPDEKTSLRRITRGRYKVPAKNPNYLDEPVQVSTRTRGKKQTQATDHTEEPLIQKRSLRRGAKKTDDEMPTPMETDNKPATPIQTPDAKIFEEINTSSVDKTIEEGTTSVKQTPSARRTRMPRNVGNNNNLNNNNINKIAANLSAKAGAAVDALNAMGTIASTARLMPAANSTTTTKGNAIGEQATSNCSSAMPRIYGRKRKNQQVMHLVHTASDDVEENPPATKVANINMSNDLGETMDVTDRSATMLGNEVMPRQSPVCDSGRALSSPNVGVVYNQQRQTAGLDLHESNSNSQSISRPASTTPASPPPQRDYKIKDKFKRTLTLDNQANNCNAMVVSANTSHDVKVSDLEQEDHQRGSVKLVISKKKGSIFKSRALAPTIQSEQAPSTKRHLYKHRWDAEANGGISNETSTSPANANDTQSQTVLTRTNVADNIFDDFSDVETNVSTLRDNNSPTLGKLTRVVKPNPQVYSNSFDMDEDGMGTASHVETITSVKVDRKAKEYYTVVRNVKTAHQIQEIGEYQEMDDDVEYILDALQPHNPTPTRCLSALQLATKCMTSAFRMHVRAHGIVTKFFKALSDANTDLSLGLCTSAIMYILSQEGLNMDLDRDSLELMMNLLESETVAAPSDRANYERNKQKVRELCEEIKAQGKATHLNMDSITVGTLAMETLLSLTSKRAGEWFKDELRELGGLEHIIKTISECCRPILLANNVSGVLWSQSLIDNMQTVLRCLRVLENVTQMNEENQKYILTYAQGTAIDTLLTLYSLCAQELKLHPTTVSSSRDSTGVVIRELLIHVVKVLITLTHTFNPTLAMGAEMLGKRAAVLETSLHLIMQSPKYIPERSEFELCMLVLSILINITMHSKQNRTIVMNSYAPSECSSHQNEQQIKVTAIQAIMEYFWKCEEMAMLVEENTDAYLDKNKEKTKKKQEEVDETVNNLLASAGTHMEHTLKCSYVGILVGYLVTDSEEYEAIVRTHLHGNGFKEIIAAIDKYHTFMNLTGSSEVSIVSHNKDIKKLMDYLKKRDLIYEMNESNDCAHPLNLEKHKSHYSSTSNDDDDNDNSSTRTGELGTSQRVYKTYSQR